MITNRAVATLAILLCVVAAEATPRSLEVATQAEGCATTRATGCNLVLPGQIATGDCTYPTDGTRYDRYEISLPVGHQVAFTLRPIDTTYTTPDLLVIPPIGEVQQTRNVFGPKAATLWVQTFTSGTWVVAVGTRDLFAAGRYVLHVDCFSGTDPRRDCIYQELLCGHTGFGEITAESCRFSTGARGYDAWSIYGIAGDVLNVTMDSSDYEPLFGIYGDDPNPLKSSTRVSSSRATMSFPVPMSGWYHINATTSVDNQAGDYRLSVSCSTSGCLFPHFRSNIADIKVPPGAQATINLDLSVIGSFTATLREDLAVVATSTTSTLQTPPITFPRRFFVSVETPCGDAQSNVFTVQNTCSAPAITRQPAHTETTRGNTAQFSVEASGTTPLTYQWYEGTFGDASRPIPSSNSATLSIIALQTQWYWVRVQNECGTADSTAGLLTVNVPKRRSMRK